MTSYNQKSSSTSCFKADIANHWVGEDDQIFIPSAGDVIEYHPYDPRSASRGTSLVDGVGMVIEVWLDQVTSEEDTFTPPLY